MTLDEINEQIAQIMQEKAEEQALAHYVAPRASSRFDYIMNGDRSGLDKFDASEQAYANMLAKQRMANDEANRQRIFNELSKEADRLNAAKIASKNVNTQQADKDALIQKEYDFAQIELDAAKDKLDIDNPDSIAALKKAVKKANYWGKQLPKDYGFELEMLPDDTSLVDSKSVRIKKKVDKANALLSREGTAWKDEHYKEADSLSQDPEIPEVTRLQLAAKVANKGEGAETKAKNWAERKKRLLDNYNKMNPNQKRVWKKNNPKTAKAIGV